jgi:hypothetical protein
MSQIPQPTSQDTSVDQLTSQLAIISIAHDTNGQWVYFPPGTSIEEQLLILAGVQDYTLNGSAEQKFSNAEMSRTDVTSSRAGAGSTRGFDAKQAMSQHLDMLEDTELASLMHTSLRLNAPLATHTTPSSPPSAGYQGSYPPGSLGDLEYMYTQALRQCNTPDDLADATLPMCDQELWELSNFMQRQIWWMMADRDLRWMVKAPKAHPLYPYWVLPGTGKQYAGEMEMEMDM